MQKKLLKSINEKLKVIMLLLLQLKLKPNDPESPTLRNQIKLLNALGLRAKEIADVLGRSNIYINKEIFKLRKLKKNKK